MKMNFGTNKTPMVIIKEVAFGGTYFRDIIGLIDKNYWKKQMIDIKIVVVKKKLLNIISQINMLQMKKQKISMEICLKKKKKQKGNMEKIGTET